MAVPKGFEVGDTVLVERNGTNVRRSKNWNNGWSPVMDSYVGKCFTIESISTTGIRFGAANNPSGSGVNYGFPPSVLRLIKRGDTAYFRKGDKVIVARHAEGTIPHWASGGGMDGTLGKVYEVSYEKSIGFSDVLLKTETGQWWYGIDCLELYTGDAPKPKASSAVPVFTIDKDEPLQSWERL
jgi:hypothetical protein